MRRGPDRLNTVVLTLLALVLLGVGGYGLARGYGAFGDDQADDPVLGDEVREFVSDNANWFWPVAAVASLLIAWLGLRWLLAQVSGPSVTRLRVPAEGPGRTDLLASGAAAALARDIEEYPGVKGARARVVGDDPSPELDITVDVHDDADVPALRRRIEEHALERFRSALELQHLRPEVHIRLAERAARSVH